MCCVVFCVLVVAFCLLLAVCSVVLFDVGGLMVGFGCCGLVV